MRKSFRKFKRFINDCIALQKQKKVLPRFLKKAKGEKILLISHQLTTTGAPLVLYHLAKELIDQGFAPLVLSYWGGSLTKEFKKLGVEVLLGDVYSDHPDVLRELASHFDKTIVNTIVCYSAVDVIKDAVWWIHEGQYVETGFMQDYPNLESVLRKAENVFVVSEYAKETVDKFSPNSQIIRLGVEDFYRETPKSSCEKVKFALVGNVCACKAQDVVADAILKMDKKYLNQSEFHFFCEKKGRRYRELVKKLHAFSNVFYDGIVLDQDEKWAKFSDIDVFLVPSRDESLSLVALEACMLKKPIILSENVGAGYMVKEGENGFILPTADSDALKAAIEKLIDNKSELQKMGEVSRQMYEEFATFENHQKELKKIIDLCK